MGEMPSVRMYTSGTMYSDDGCMQKQSDDGYTKLNPAGYPAVLHYDGTKYVTKTPYVVTPAGKYLQLLWLNCVWFGLPRTEQLATFGTRH